MKTGHIDNRGLADIILKSLSKDPACRFQTGEAMAAALNRCLDPAAHPFPETGHPIENPARAKRTGLILALFGLCLVAGIVSYTVMRKPVNELSPAGTALSPVASSTLAVTSTPDGAQVFVDSMFKGITPLDISLIPGSYEVRLNLPDHYEWEAQIQIGEEDPAPLTVRLVSIN